MRTPLVAAAAVLSFAAGACSCEQALVPSTGSISVSPVAVDLGTVALCHSAQRVVEFSTAGRTTVSIRASELPSGVRVEPEHFDVVPGSVSKVLVGCSPQTLGDHSGEVRFVSSGGQVLSLPLAFKVVEHDVEVPGVLDFGSIVLSSIKSLSVPILNKTADRIEVRSFLPSDSAFVTGWDHSAIAPLEQHVLPITFIPPSAGSYSSILRVESCPGARPLEVLVQARALETVVRAEPDGLQFGMVTVGKSRSLEIQLKNVGEVSASLTVVLEQEAGFALHDEEARHVLAEGATLQIPVRFTPNAIGGFAGRLRIIPESSAPFTVPLSGQGGGPELTAEPRVIDFGTIAVGSKLSRRVSIRNIGEATAVSVIAADLEAPQPGFIATPERPIPTDVSTLLLEIDVDFKPEVAGIHQGELVVSSDDLDTPMIRVPITGMAAGTPFCELQARPGTLRFGLVRAGKRHTRELALVNASSSECQLFDIAIDRETAGSFALVSPPSVPLTVLPGGAA